MLPSLIIGSRLMVPKGMLDDLLPEKLFFKIEFYSVAILF